VRERVLTVGGGMATVVVRMWRGAAAARSPVWTRGEHENEGGHVGSGLGEKMRGEKT
jgi:hypothetical protein